MGLKLHRQSKRFMGASESAGKSQTQLYILIAIEKKGSSRI